MSESVEQAALRRAHAKSSEDWKGHAEREAVAILDSLGYLGFFGGATRGTLIALMSAAWLQGVDYGAHETLTAVEAGLAKVQAAL